MIFVVCVVGLFILDVCFVGDKSLRVDLLILLVLLLLLWFIESTLVLLCFADTASMGAIFRSLKMNHAIKAGKGCAAALVTMTVEFLLREDVSTALARKRDHGEKIDAVADLWVVCCDSIWTSTMG